MTCQRLGGDYQNWTVIYGYVPPRGEKSFSTKILYM